MPMLRRGCFAIGMTVGILSALAQAALAQGATPTAAMGFPKTVGAERVSRRLDVFRVDRKRSYTINGQAQHVGAGFQPSVVFNPKDGVLHVFFQARLGGSGDTSAKMIAHVRSRDFGQSFSEPQFVNRRPMQTYAMSSFIRTAPSGATRLSVLTSLSIDETVARHKDPQVIQDLFDIDVTAFSRKAAALVVEFYSDDSGTTWNRRYLPGISDRVYRRNGKDYYLAFMNLIGQVRQMDGGPHRGRLILAGPLRGSYLPCPDHARFRQYHASSSLIYSDDGGETWTFGGVIADETAFAHNEASAVAVNDGQRILMVRRRNRNAEHGKVMHYSDDGGQTWQEGFVSPIPATRCLQVLETHGNTVLCSAPAMRNRTHGTIYFSRDHGKTWNRKLIEEGPFSYSTVQRLTGAYLMCCYSRGHHGESGVAARIFAADWLEQPDAATGRPAPDA